MLTAPAVWQAPGGAIWVYYGNDSGIAGYRLASPSAGAFRLDRVLEYEVLEAVGMDAR